MSLIRAGFVGLFAEPLGQDRIAELVRLWIERYGMVEQTAGSGSQVLTQVVRSVSDIAWEENLQFRVLCGEQFCWIYMTQNRHIIETSGLSPANGTALCQDVLMNLPGCDEIVDEHNDRRLDELEATGVI